MRAHVRRSRANSAREGFVHAYEPGRAMRRFLLSCATALSILGVGLPLRGAEVEGDASLLLLVASAYRANVDRLQTWAGIVEARDVRTEPTARVQYTSSLEYAVDFTTERARWQWNYTSFTRADGSGTHHLAPFREAGLLKDDLLYLMKSSGAKRASATVASAGERLTGPATTHIDAITHWLRIGGLAVDSWLKNLHNSLPQQPGRCTIERQGQLVVVRTEDPSIDQVDENSFDVSQGGLCIAGHTREGDRTIRHRAKLVRVAEVWVPCLVEYENSAGNGLSVTRKLEWKRNEVNAALDDDAFTLAAMGLRPGDLLFDKRTGARSRYEGEAAPVPPRELARDAPPAGRSPWRHAAWALAAVVAGGAVWWLFRRRRRADPSGTPPPG